MAQGYAQATGQPGVAIVTSGPGATNIVTPLCDAYMDSVPLVVITGQVPYAAIGTDAFQECDTTGITMSVTKHNFLVSSATELPQIIHDAFHIATTGRPGPVLVDIPKCIVDPRNPRSGLDWYEPTDHDLPGYNPRTEPDATAVAAAAELICAARRPVIYSGGGILKARAADALLRFAELVQIPVVTTLMNRGGFPDDHPLCLGMPGMHGNYTAVTSMQRADLLITLGARFDDRVTGKVGAFAPEAKIIHLDIDPGGVGQGAPGRRGHRRRLPSGDRSSHPRRDRTRRRRRPGRPPSVARHHRRLAAALPAGLRLQRRGRAAEAAVRAGAVAGRHARRHDRLRRGGPASDVGQPVLALQPPLHLDQLRWSGHDGLRGAGGDRRQGREARPDGVGGGTATAASR